MKSNTTCYCRSKELYFREFYMIIGNAEVQEIMLNTNILTIL